MKESTLEKKTLKCKECGKAFTLNITLQKHMIIHTGDGPYKCKECEKVFMNPSSLKIHESSHTGERPYRCQCGKTLRTQNVFRVHKSTHSRGKTLQIKIFVRKFTSTYVQARERIHTGQKPSLNHSKTNWTTHWTEII